MRISVNLATRPFIELRPLYARLRLAAVALTFLAVLLGIALHFLNARARVAEAKMNALKAKTLEYQQLRQHNEARMHQPQNMAVLERSQFLNALFAKKSFSWTAVMMDLERVLPAGVQVTSIEPATSKSGDVSIRLRVSGERERAVELVGNLEKSQRFIAPRLATESAQVEEGHSTGTPGLAPGAVEFDIYSGYNPLPVAVEKKVKTASVADKDDKDKLQTKSSDLSKTKRSRNSQGTKASPAPHTPGAGPR